MIGVAKSIPSKNGVQQQYVFLRADKEEYFLHASDLSDSWDILKAKLASNKEVRIEFEPINGAKGLRASNAFIIS